MSINNTYNLGIFFSNIAESNAQKEAIKFIDGAEYSFNYLEKASNRIASYLMEQGIEKNDVVAILNNKSRTSYAIMLACLKIGAIYTNLDPNSPIERFQRMLDLCNPKNLFFFEDQNLINENSRCLFPSMQLINFESEEFLLDIENLSEIFPENNKDVDINNPAYIMFTSGSTGFPKGAVITHGNVLNFIKWARDTYTVTEKDVFTNINPMHFDNSVFDFYASIFNGASMIPINQTLSRNPRRMIEALNKVSPTIWFSVPSMLVYVLNMRALKEEDLPTLRTVTFGGEGFPKNQLRKLWSYWGDKIQFINVYGPTECTCICSSYVVKEKDLQSDELLPLGPMTPGFYALILDENEKEVKKGTVGELYIGGPNVGLGYYNNVEKTQSAFINDPTLKDYHKTVYKSGDLVKEDIDGGLLFCGRKDNQIKKMGYRIELEEIENALNSIDMIFESAVIYVDNKKNKSKIIAFIKSKIEEKLIEDILKKKLPLYMMPDSYIYREDLPKNQNGKIDRIALRKEFEA